MAAYSPAMAVPAGPKVPTTGEGAQLALEVDGSAVLTADAKRPRSEIVNHGARTRTFIKKVRKQARSAQIGQAEGTS